MHTLQFAPQAAKFYRSATENLRVRLQRCFEQISENPRQHPNIKPLRGPLAGLYRYRLGDYRIVYRIDDVGQIVIVEIIAHRRDVYE